MPTDTSIFEPSSCHYHEDQDIHVDGWVVLGSVRPWPRSTKCSRTYYRRGGSSASSGRPDNQLTGTSRLVCVSDRESLFTKVQLISTCFVDNIIRPLSRANLILRAISPFLGRLWSRTSSHEACWGKPRLFYQFSTSQATPSQASARRKHLLINTRIGRCFICQRRHLRSGSWISICYLMTPAALKGKDHFLKLVPFRSLLWCPQTSNHCNSRER